MLIKQMPLNKVKIKKTSSLDMSEEEINGSVKDS